MRSTDDDIELIDRCQHGDREAFGEIVGRYQDRIYNLCVHLLGNRAEADDMAQATFLKAYRNLGKYQPKAALYTWLYRIAVNTCLDHLRRPLFESIFRRSPSGEEFVLDHPSTAPSPEKNLENTQLHKALRNALGKLSPKLRAVIVLKELEGLAYEEIAATLEISLGTVKSRISRARSELQGLLQEFREPK
jgi:RNA polymerase sigma-70 factor (ECF subfamily)